MASGNYRERIVIQKPSQVRNGYGEMEEGWVDFLSVRAGFNPLYGREFFASEQTQSQVEVKFFIRYRKGIESNYRVLHKGISYEILYPPIDVRGMRLELLLYCKKVE